MSRRRTTRDERDAFLLKVIDFRQSLTPGEQRILDAIAVAAFCEEPTVGPLTRDRLRPHDERSPWMQVLGAGD